MLVNNGLGEISRAMRNRGIEIALDQGALSSHGDILLNAWPCSNLNAHFNCFKAGCSTSTCCSPTFSGEEEDGCCSISSGWRQTVLEDCASLRLQRASGILNLSLNDEMATGLFTIIRLTSKSLLPHVKRVIRQLNVSDSKWVIEALERAVKGTDSSTVKQLRQTCLLASEHEPSETDTLVSDAGILQ